IRHLGGKMLDTRTRLHAAIPADRSASSNEVSFSRCLPTPLVKNISFGTNPTTWRSLLQRTAGRLHGKQQLFQCQCSRGFFAHGLFTRGASPLVGGAPPDSPWLVPRSSR